MGTRIRTICIVSLLVVLAGCSAGGGNDDGSDISPTTSPPGAGDDSTTTGDVTLVGNRTAELVAAGSYTATWRMEFTRAGERIGSTTYTTAVDYANERSSFEMRMVDEGEARNDYETFYADGVSYTRQGTGEDATYRMAEATFAPGNTLFPVHSNIDDPDDLADFAAVGTETYDGVTVTRYERTDRPTWIDARNADGEFTWTAFTYTVLVDRQGLVRSEGWRGEGVTDDGVSQTMAFSYSLTAVGSTEIEEPEWIATARDGAG